MASEDSKPHSSSHSGTIHNASSLITCSKAALDRPQPYIQVIRYRFAKCLHMDSIVITKHTSPILALS